MVEPFVWTLLKLREVSEEIVEAVVVVSAAVVVVSAVVVVEIAVVVVASEEAEGDPVEEEVVVVAIDIFLTFICQYNSNFNIIPIILIIL